MTFEEKNVWVFALVTACSYAAYVAVVLGRARGVPIHEVAYAGPMLWTIGLSVAATILLSIAVGVSSREDCGRKDERDREIHRFGEYVGQSFLVIGGVSAMGLAMAEAEHFWIANAVYLCFVLSALLGSAAKIVAYRRGFQVC